MININSFLIAILIVSSFIAKVIASLGIMNEGLLPLLLVIMTLTSVGIAIIFKYNSLTINRYSLYIVLFLMVHLLISVSIYGIHSLAYQYLISFLAFGMSAFILIQFPFDSKKVIYYVMILGNLIMISMNKYVAYTTEETIFYKKMDMGATYALLPSIFATLIYFVFLRKKSKLRFNKMIEYLSLISAFYMLYLVITIGNRGAVLSVLIFLLTIIYIKVTQQLKGKGNLLYPAFFIMVGSIALYIMSISTKILYTIYDVLLSQGIEVVSIIKTVNLIERDGLIGILNARDNLYSVAINMFKESPFIGSGAGSFATENTGPHIYPHNLFLHLLSEGGLFLSIPFIVVILLTIILMLRPWKTKSITNNMKLLILLLVIISLPRLFISSYFWRDQAFWLMIFLTLDYYMKKGNYTPESD